MARSTVPFTCVSCGKEYQAVKSELARGKGKTCGSKTCANHQRKISQKGKARPLTPAGVAAHESPEYRQKLRVAQQQRWQDPELYPRLQEAIRRRSESRQWRNAAHHQPGARNPRFQGGRVRKRDDNRYRYRKWRSTVLARDRYTCQLCGARSRKGMNAHHMKPWKDNPSLRYDVANGMTLCHACHRQHHYGVSERAETTS